MKGYIYSIRSNQTKDIYIGSTIQKYLSQRLAGHKADYKLKKDNISSYEILQFDDAYIELIEIVEFNDKNELRAREGHYIRTIDCINKQIAGRTQKEWTNDNKERLQKKAQQFYRDNKEKIEEQKKQYRIDNKERLNEKENQYRIDNREKINQRQREQRQLKKDNLDKIIIE